MGNFSKNPDEVLQDALDKGYNRVLFQQGKPVLDRELNLLADLASPQRLIEHHIGNGVPDGSDGFRISNIVPGTDFTISAGRCLVGGYEIVLSADTTYQLQPHASTSLPGFLPGNRAYLRVFTSEVNGTQDSGLNNPASTTNPDVGFETAVRKKVEWEVIVTADEITTQDHMLLAIFEKKSPYVADCRRIGLTVASMRDEVTAARGSQASLDARLDVSLNENGTLANGATVTGDLMVNGKLGIGTTTPGTALDVSRISADAVVRAQTTTSGNSALSLLNNGNQEYQISANRVTNRLEISGPGAAGVMMSFEPNTGNAGIGTNNKLARLTVKGKSASYITGTVATTAGSATVTGTGTTFLSRVGIGDRIYVPASGAAPAETRIVTAITSDTDLTADSVYTGSRSGVQLLVYPGIFRADDFDGNAKLSVSYQGNVGIGTATPQNKLDVEGGAVIGATYSGTNTAPVNGLLVEGKVGIGKAPNTELDVQGTVTATAFAGNGIVPKGVIAMWYGIVSNVPAGWAICDGQNGTPDLRNRFVVAAGSTYTPGQSGGPDSHQHQHTVAAFSMNTATDGAHVHRLPSTWYHRSFDSGQYTGIDIGGGSANITYTENGGSVHGHGINVPSLSTDLKDPNGAENRPRWYALLYIMKL